MKYVEWITEYRTTTLIAKWFLQGKGTCVEVMRRLMLVWFVNCLGLVLGRGIFYGAIAWTMVLMIVFEEVTRIGKLQEFCICAGINFCVLLCSLRCCR